MASTLLGIQTEINQLKLIIKMIEFMANTIVGGEMERK